jgi:hypothetical protein
MATLTHAQIRALRMQALGLVGKGLQASHPRAVVAHFLAMQAQDFRASRWAIGARLPGCTDQDVVAAFNAGELVRSWPMRGTVHVTLAEDLPWMNALMGVRALSGVRRRWDALGIDEAFLERARAVVMERLEGGGRATRAALTSWLEEEGLRMDGQRTYHTVWYLAQTGTLVQGPVEDGDHLLVRTDAWIACPPPPDRDSALHTLGRRYLQARGPATEADLAWWSGLPLRDVRTALRPVGGDIVALQGPDGLCHALASHLDTQSMDPALLAEAAHALPAFDEHLLGFRTRDAVLDPAHATLVDPARNGVFRWTLVDAGRVFATWSRRRLTHHTVAEVRPFGPVPSALQERATRALEAWARFEGSRVEVVWG